MRWIFRLVGLIVVLAIVAAGSILMLPGDRIARIAADQLGAMTGREVRMQGDTTVSFWPVLGISTGPVTIANADWAGEAPMFAADSLKIGVEPQALFGGDIRITGLEATAPAIRLVRAADGRVNWELGIEGVAPSGQGTGDAPARSNRLSLTLDRALITNASVSITDNAQGTSFRLDGTDFDLRWPDYEGTATFDAVLRPAGTAVRLSGHLDRVGDFIDGAVSDVAVTIGTQGGEATFTGQVATAPEASGRLTAGLSDTAGFLAALGLTGVEVPRGLGRVAEVQGTLSLSREGRVSLRDTVLQLDDNRLTGAADIVLSGARPRLNVQLRAGALDLSGLGASGGAGESGTTTASERSVVQEGWSKAPIDASALGLADGEVALVADSVDLGALKLGKLRTLARLDRSRLVFDLRELRAYDGLITGEFVMNNRSGLSVGGKIAADDINLQTLLRDAMDITRLEGSADGEVQFLGVGQSMHAIMNSLSGSGAFKTGRGVISGFDLDRLMRSGDGTGGTTVFDTLQATFTMDKGNLYNDDLGLSLPRASATGAGRVGLGARDIDYVFTPRLLDGGGSGLAIPVKIRGPWANPRITPDLEAAIDLNFKEEKQELERKAREEVEREVEKQLGIERQEGQSLEDAAKDALEKELERGILKLFD